jgi:hypothetical protein
MGEDEVPKKILEEPGGYRKVGLLRLRWLVELTDDLGKNGMRNWRGRTQDRELPGGRPMRKPKPTSSC